IPQTFYYFYAYAQLLAQGMSEVVFSVPSGNFGNIGAGLLAAKMGLPVHRFIAATNVNDTVPRFLETGEYVPRPSVQTLSNAMDVGNPSNWVRVLDLFGTAEAPAVARNLEAYTFNDSETQIAIRQIYDTYGYVACPHTAIAWLALEAYRKNNPGSYAGVFLATAHPCKFPDAFEPDIQARIDVPASVGQLEASQRSVTAIEADFGKFKAYLLANE